MKMKPWRSLRAKFVAQKVDLTRTGSPASRRLDPHATSFPWITASAKGGYGNPMNARLRMNLEKWRRESHEEYDQNELYKRAVNFVATAAVGGGFRLKRDLSVSLPAMAKEEALRVAWREHLDGLDYRGFYDKREMEMAVARSFLIDGEAFGIIRDSRLELVDPRRIRTNLTEVVVSDNERQLLGVVLDSEGRRRAYLVSGLSEDEGSYISAPELARVPADICLHAMNADHPGQLRGIPFFHAALPDFKKLRDFQEQYSRISLMRLKVLGWFQDQPGRDDAVGELLENPLPGVVTDEVWERMDSSAKMRALLNNIIDEKSTLQILTAPGGKSFSTSVNTTAVDSYTGYNRSQQMSILGSLMPMLLGDFTGANYISGRLLRINHKDMLQEMQEKILAKIYRPLFRRFLQEWAFRTGAQLARLIGAYSLVPPEMEHIQPREVALGNDVALKNGTKTRGMVIEETLGMGYSQFKEIERNEILLDQKFGGPGRPELVTDDDEDAA